MDRMTKFRRSAAVSMAVVLATALSASPVFAGTGAIAQPSIRHPTDKGAAAADAGAVPTSEELDDFAHAVVATGNIKRAARQGIVDAPTPANRDKLEQATTNEIKAAIRGNHLSVRRYLQIVTFVQANPAMQRKVVARLKLLVPPLPPQQPLNP